MPNTSASSTAGCSLRISSTSSGNTFSPPVLMHCEPRPNSVMVPSVPTLAQSPGTEWHAVDLPEGGGRLCLIPEVAERDRTGNGDQAHLSGARLDVVTFP